MNQCFWNLDRFYQYHGRPKDQQINGEANNEDTAPTREANAAWPILESISAVVASDGHY